MSKDDAPDMEGFLRSMSNFVRKYGPSPAIQNVPKPLSEEGKKLKGSIHELHDEELITGDYAELELKILSQMEHFKDTPMSIPDPVERIDAAIERQMDLIDKDGNYPCYHCERREKPEDMFPVSSHPAAPLVCLDCAQEKDHGTKS